MDVRFQVWCLGLIYVALAGLRFRAKGSELEGRMNIVDLQQGLGTVCLSSS